MCRMDEHVGGQLAVGTVLSTEDITQPAKWKTPERSKKTKIQYSHIVSLNSNKDKPSQLSFINQIKGNQATQTVCATLCTAFDSVIASFRRASRLQFQQFLQMVNRKVRQLRRDWWVCADSSLDKNMALHVHRTTFVWVLHHPPSCCQLALVLGRTDDTGLSRTYVPTNPGEPRQRAGSHFTKRSCWWFVLRVCSDMQTGRWTRHRHRCVRFSYSCSCHKTDFKTFTTKLKMWISHARE